MTAQHHQSHTVFHFRVSSNQLVTGLNEVLNALIFIGDALRCEQNKLFIGRQSQPPGSRYLIVRSKEVGVDGVRNGCHRMVLQ